MKIIQLSGGREPGGREKYALALAGAFEETGEETETLTKGEETVDAPFRKAGLTVGRLPLGGDFDFLTPVLLARKLRREEARRVLVVTYSLREAAAAVKARELTPAEGKEIRVILIQAWPEDVSGNARAAKTYGAVDAIVFLSEAARRRYAEAWPDIDAGRTHTVYPGVRSKHDGNGSEDGKGIGEDSGRPLTLLWAGRITEGRGLETLFKALGKLADLPLRLRVAGVGRGPYVSSLKGEVWRNGLTERVEWLSRVEDVDAEARRADIGLVVADRPDSHGLALLELMAEGRPVVATGIGVHKEIMTDGQDGLLVSPGDPDALAEAIRKLATNPRVRQELGESARHTVSERFTHTATMRGIRRIVSGIFG